MYLGPNDKNQYTDIDYEGFTVTDSTTADIAKLIAQETIENVLVIILGGGFLPPNN